MIVYHTYYEAYCDYLERGFKEPHKALRLHIAQRKVTIDCKG